MSGETYPLWCTDTGDKTSESRYGGPFDTEQAAINRRDDLMVMDGYRFAKVRKCRRVSAAGYTWSVEDMIERAEEQLGDGGAPVGGWAKWDDTLVESTGMEAAQSALDAWATKHLRCFVYICEDDDGTPR